MADTASWKTMLAAMVVITVLASVVTAGIGATTNVGERIQTNTQAFDQLCTELYGEDAYTYTEGAALSSGHSGRHCEGADAQDATIHLTQIPDDVWTQYKAGEVDAAYVTAHLESPPGLFSLGGGWTHILLTTAAIAIAVVAIAVVQRYRHGPPEATEE